LTGTTWSPFLPAETVAVDPVQPARIRQAQADSRYPKARFREAIPDERCINSIPVSGFPAARQSEACGSPGTRSRIIAILIDDVEHYVKGYPFTAFSTTYSSKELGERGGFGVYGIQAVFGLAGPPPAATCVRASGARHETPAATERSATKRPRPLGSAGRVVRQLRAASTSSGRGSNPALTAGIKSITYRKP